jgi:flagellar basal body-associated protein FliL
VEGCLGRADSGYDRTMLTILLIILVVLLLTGGIGYSRRGRRL